MSQSDSLFPKAGTPYAVLLKEIGETVISYGKPGSSLTFTVFSNDIEKIKFGNGTVEKIKSTTNTDTVNESKKETITDHKKTIDQELKSKIEKLSVEAGNKIGKCALGPLENLSTSIDWGITQYDAFNPSHLLIYLKVIYDRDMSPDRDFFYIKLTMDEETKSIKWKLLNASNKSDEVSLLKCQKKSL